MHESRNATEEFKHSPDPHKFNTDLVRAVENTNALASHIISALKLSGCNEVDQAAALMEAMRFVGRTLTNNREVPCSQATAMCLATISPIYARPNWFTKKLASTLSQQIHPDLLHEIGKYFLKNKIEKCHDTN